MELVNRLLATVRREHLWTRGDRLLVACSGGPDSMALLGLLARIEKEEGLTIGVLTVDHQLRPSSASELAMVADFAKTHAWSFYGFHKNVRAMAKRCKQSLELAGRNVRYALLKRVAKREGYDAVVLGHHANDQMETIVSHILRGTGLTGLRGMAYKRGLYVRPLLDMEKEELETYVIREQIPYVIDETNFSLDYERNQIRHEIIPALEALNPQLCTSLQRLANVVSLDDEYIQGEVEHIWGQQVVKESQGPLRYSVQRHKVAAFPKALRYRLWRKMATHFYPYGCMPSLQNIESMDALLFLQGNKQFSLKWMKIYSQYDKIYFAQSFPLVEEERPTNGDSYFPTWKEGQSFTKRIPKGMFLLPKERAEQGLVIRQKAMGDRIVLLNKERQVVGHKSLKKYMNEQKIPVEERREKQWLVAGDIVLCMATPQDSFVLYEGQDKEYVLGYFEEERK